MPTGLLRAEQPQGLDTLIVKITYDLQDGSAATLATNQVELTVGERLGDEVTLHPNDFVPAKLACDVVLVGAVLAREAGPVRFSVGPLDRFAPRAALLAALPEATAEGAVASPQQQMPEPRFPLELIIEHAGVTRRTMLVGPAPEAALVLGERFGHAEALPLTCDTLLLDLADNTCTLVFRGSFRRTVGEPEPLLLVDASARLGNTRARELRRWPTGPLIEAGALAEAEDREDFEVTRAGPTSIPAPRSDAAPALLIPRAPRAPRAPLHTLDLDTDRRDSEGTRPSIDIAALRRELPFRSADTNAAEPPVPAMPFARTKSGTQDVSRTRARHDALPFIKTPSEKALPDDRNRPLMFLAPQGTPLAYPPTPFSRQPAPPDPVGEDDEPTPLPASLVPTDDVGEVGDDSPTPLPAARTSHHGALTLPPPASAPEDTDDGSELATIPPPPLAATPFRARAAQSPALAEGVAPPPAVAPALAEFRPGGGAKTEPPPAPAPAALPFARPREQPTFEKRAYAPQAPVAFQQALAELEAELAAPEKRVGGMTLSDYVGVRRALWSERRPRRLVLRTKGLSELGWRSAERAWGDEIASIATDPAAAAEFLTRLQAAVEAETDEL